MYVVVVNIFSFMSDFLSFLQPTQCTPRSPNYWPRAKSARRSHCNRHIKTLYQLWENYKFAKYLLVSKNVTHLETMSLVITDDGPVNVNWLRIAAVQAGLTLAGVLPQSEVFDKIRYVPSEARCSHYAKFKEAIPPLLFKSTFIIKQIPCFDILEREFMPCPRTVVCGLQNSNNVCDSRKKWQFICRCYSKR